MKEFLADLGINIGISVAGFFGSLVMIGKTSAYELKKTMFSILAGVASANYLTPIVSDMLRITNQQYQYSIAFVMGFLGLKGIEIVADKLIKNKVKNEHN